MARSDVYQMLEEEAKLRSRSNNNNQSQLQYSPQKHNAATAKFHDLLKGVADTSESDLERQKADFEVFMAQELARIRRELADARRRNAHMSTTRSMAWG